MPAFAACRPLSMRPLALPRAGLAGAVCALGLMAAVQDAQAQSRPGAGGIYTCNTPDGRRLTSDRPIPECASREQRVLNADGSVRTVMPPAMSPQEQAAHEERLRQQAAERAAYMDAVRRDRNLLQRFRDEPAHQRARVAALDDINKGMALSEKRLVELAAERKPLLDEAEFYKGKPVPFKLKHQLDTNDASADAQRQLIENQKAERVRVNKLFDDELARLKRLWAGAAPGNSDPRPDGKPAASGASR